MKRILITGGNGFVASNLIAHFQEDYELFATVRDNNVVNDLSHFETIDLAAEDDMRYFIKDVRPDILIHAAAISSDAQCEKDLSYSNFINVESLKYLSESCNQIKAQLQFLSTDLVFYGDQAPYSEDDRRKPKMTYGKQKVQAEDIVGLSENHLILRIPLMYGIGQSNRKGLLMQLIQDLKAEKECNLFEDEFRSPLAVSDLCGALDILIKREARGLFHVAGKERINRYDFGIKVAEAFNLNKDFCSRKKQSDFGLDKKRPKNVCLNIDKLIALNFQPKSIADNLALIEEQMQTV